MKLDHKKPRPLPWDSRLHKSSYYRFGRLLAKHLRLRGEAVETHYQSTLAPMFHEPPR
jgi:hypothetical protein